MEKEIFFIINILYQNYHILEKKYNLKYLILYRFNQRMFFLREVIIKDLFFTSNCLSTGKRH
jgi:hypothetical protein